MFSLTQQQTLLRMAREAIITAVRERKSYLPEIDDDSFLQMRGAFVTLTMGDELRGCIGFPEPIYPLYQAISKGAISAALSDPRFPPVSHGEVDALEIEISVLSPLAPIKPEEVMVGTHGLVIEQGRARGLLLPQVPVEYGWTREEFLNYTCRKANLPLDAWCNGASLFAFTAEVFSEGTTP